MVNKIEDLSMTANQMRDGVFLGLAIDGIKKIPNDSIDIIITEPPKSPLEDINKNKKPITIQKYFEWNKNWLKESSRILKQTGGIYLICKGLSSLIKGPLSGNCASPVGRTAVSYTHLTLPTNREV